MQSRLRRSTGRSEAEAGEEGQSGAVCEGREQLALNMRKDHWPRVPVASRAGFWGTAWFQLSGVSQTVTSGLCNSARVVLEALGFGSLLCSRGSRQTG